MAKKDEVKKDDIQKSDEADQENIDLQKSLSENLEKMNELKKSTESGDIKEMMKNPANRKKMKGYMAEYEDEDEDDEKDEKKKEKSKMKKSLDNLENDNEEVIDAVPVLNDFITTLKSFNSTMEEMKNEIIDLKKSQEDMNDFQKSMGDVIESESNLIKSLSDEVEKVGSQPEKVKGALTKDQILNKSFSGEEPADKHIELVKSYSVPVLQNALIKSVQDGELPGSVVSKWELSHYNSNYLNPKVMAIISKNLPKEVM